MSILETNILFWNVQRNQPGQHIVDIAQTYNTDIILIAESGYIDVPGDLVEFLNRGLTPGSAQYEHIGTTEPEGKVQIFSRIPSAQWMMHKHHSRYQIWSISRLNRLDLYLAAVHFSDPTREQGDGQRKLAVDLRLDIQSLEEAVLLGQATRGHVGLPIIAIGDFNASPFEEGIVGIYALNATSRRNIASEGAREMDNKFYPYMYNPMWQFLQVADDRPAGTYYKRLSKPICYFWYALDQALIRPALLDNVSDSDIRIVESTGQVSLIQSNGTPVSISDHLPIAVTVHG